MTRTTAIIQARVGSTRLPGKVMYPLDGRPALEHVVKRVAYADCVNDVVVATSTKSQDDVIEQYVPEFGADVVRGSEEDVLSRFENAIKQCDSEIVLRVTGDCPLISPDFIKTSVERIQNKDAEYVNIGSNRTFPRGVTCEAFTADSFKRVSKKSDKPRHREHVTPYYRENPAEFDLYGIESSEVFDESWLQDRTDLRLTLDEPADYQLIETVYRKVECEEMIDLAAVIRYIDENGLAEINEHVEQKSV